jgi:hypothetical protein
MPVPGIEGDDEAADEPESEADENDGGASEAPEDNLDVENDEPPTVELRDEPSEEYHDDQPDETEPDVAEVELHEDDFDGGGGLFDDVEDADNDPDTDDDGDGDDPLDALDDRGEALEGAINEGFARLGVAGLPDDEQDDLEGEFTEIFEAFRLGYFGSRVVEEYVFVDDGQEVDPAWGFAGSAFCALAIILWMRPDGDEQMGRITDAVGNIAGGAA